MKAIIVEGGGLKRRFAAGVLDAFMADNDVNFDLHLGTSAGAILLSSYLAKQPMRSITILKDPRTKSAFKRFSDFLKGGDFLDLDLLFEIGRKFSRLILNKFSQTQKRSFTQLFQMLTLEN